MEGVTRETHSVREHPANPVFNPHRNYPHYIVPDPEVGYRLYYNHAGGWVQHVAHSKDGINWDLPDLNVGDFDRSHIPDGPNNVIGAGEINGLFYEPHDPDPDRRWKMIVRPTTRTFKHKRWPYLNLSPEKRDQMGVPYELRVSPDGYRWKFEAETNHWKGPTADFDAPTYQPYAGSDVFRTRWDPVLRKYVGNTKHRIGPDFRLSSIFHSARVVGQIESDDLTHWSAPRIYAYPDSINAAHQPLNGMHGIYEADGYPYESMWMSNLSMTNYTPATNRQMRDHNLMDSRPYIKRNWIRAAASRNGRHWYYFGDRKPLVPLGPDGAWNSGYLRAVNLVTTGGPIVKGDELWFYYRGSTIDGPKNTWGHAMGIGILRRDGFASLNAGPDGGLVITRPFVFEVEGRLHVNVDAGKDGSLRASVVDEDTAEPLPGFTEADSSVVVGDSPRARVGWRGHETLSPHKKRYARLAFHLKNARLYSFWIE
ncbi:MAG: hypothetical protein FJ319_00720 [SAR202 cluster bacterium]|nr:hypothetical protein [SAR202 cluster bacterium]